MEWFRFYNAALHDPKVQRLAPELFRTWINLLCLASATNNSGRLPGIDDIAFALRTTEDKARDEVQALIKAGLLDEDEDGSIAPHNWSGRQRKSDDVTARVQDHRDRKRDEKKGCNVSRNEGCNVSSSKSETASRAPGRDRPRGQEQNRTDTEQSRDRTERERDAGAKPEAKTAPTVVDDDDPVPVDGPIGTNTAKQVRETIWAADQLWPMRDNLVGVCVRQWLSEHTAKRVQAAMQTAKAKGIGKPEAYIRSLLADPTFPREATGRRTAPPRPAAPELKPWVPPVLPDSMFDLTPEEEAILARKGKTA